MSIDALAKHFFEFSKIKSSPLYAALAEFISMQPEILQTVSVIPMNKSPRTILFAAVHALLLKGAKHHPLREFYPSLNGEKQVNETTRHILYADFLDFFTKYRAEIMPYLQKNTQTNEAKRSIALLPAFSEIVRKEQHSTLSLIEIGTSAGFLLNVDKYSYQLNELKLGDIGNCKPFSTKWHGNLPENLKNHFVTIENKIGIDINPLDIEDEEVRLWLKALIWPEQVDRLENFEIACDVLMQNKKNITILEGNFENHFNTSLSICSSSKILCFLSVWVLYQLNPHEKIAINEKLSMIARENKQKVYFILDDWDLTKQINANNIILREFNHRGDYIDQIVCQSDHHGGWIHSYI